MKVRTVAHDGLLVYVDFYSQTGPHNVVEVRFEHETDEHYYCQLWGNYLPTYTMFDPIRGVDRVFVRIPWSEEKLVMPLYFERVITYRVNWEENIFELYDVGRMPNYIIGLSGDYYIDQRGFNLSDGSIAINYSKPLPAKIKFLFASNNYSCTFSIYDPTQNLLKWNVQISNGTVRINSVTVGSVGSTYTEVDFGITSNRLVVSFYSGADNIISFSHSNPLNQTSSFEYIMQITGTGLVIQDFMIFNSAPEPTMIVGYQDHTDVFELITSGMPKLNYPMRYGIRQQIGVGSEVTVPTQRSIAYSSDELIPSIQTVIGEYNIVNHGVDMIIIKETTTDSGVELGIYAEYQDNHAVEIIGVEVEPLSEHSVQVSVALYERQFQSIYSAIVEYFNRTFPSSRKIGKFNENYLSSKITISDMNIYEISRHGIGIEIQKVVEEIVDYLLIAIEKYVQSVKIEVSNYDRVILEIFEYGVEVVVNED